MKANRLHQFGSPSVIVFEEVAIPRPAADEVLVRVKASGVGHWDAWIRSGKVAHGLPLTLGADLSGVVESVGEAITRFRPGDEVFGVTNSRFTGANAEYAVASVDTLAAKPRRLGHIEAASVPVVATTAWQMLFEYAHIAPGQKVLVLGAAGNVGAYAVQFARLVRAQVIATAAKGDIDFVQGLDADEIIDYRAGRFEGEIEAVDVVIDTVGGDMRTCALQLLNAGGVLVSSVSQPHLSKPARCRVRQPAFQPSVTRSHLENLASMFDAGELEVSIGSVLRLAEARIAHEMLDGMRSRPRGKIVLQSSNA